MPRNCIQVSLFVPLKSQQVDLVSISLVELKVEKCDFLNRDITIGILKKCLDTQTWTRLSCCECVNFSKDMQELEMGKFVNVIIS